MDGADSILVSILSTDWRFFAIQMKHNISHFLVKIIMTGELILRTCSLPSPAVVPGGLA